MTGLAEVIRDHAIDPRGDGYWCICGTELPLDGMRVPFSDHVAAAVTTWLEGVLAGEALREVAKEAVVSAWSLNTAEREGWHDADAHALGMATAALTAVTAALREAS